MNTCAVRLSAPAAPAGLVRPEASDLVRPLIGPGQRRAIADALAGPDRAFFRAKLAELHLVAENMPRTYQTDGQGDEALARLHYFTAGADWYITELDASAHDGEGHRQAFGLAVLNGGYPELGYISIPELLACGAELDLHWTPATVGALRAVRA